MDEFEITRLTLAPIAALIRRGQLSPVKLMEVCLERIERLNPRLNAFLTVLGESALREAVHAAEALQRGSEWGPLHGVPVGVKDLIDVAGVRTTAGSDFMRGYTAADDADVIRRLRGAGAIIIGKTHLHEFAIGVTTVNPHYGPARNPWNLECSPGGSSGGSGAAVAAWLCPAALGTDTGGSVRVPAALCGLTGLRPGKGHISTQGVVPMAWSLDTVGPMAHTAQDVALMLDVLDRRGISYTQGLERPPARLRVGVPQDDFFWLETNYQVAAAVRAAVERLADLGMEIVEISLPMTAELFPLARLLSGAEAAAFHRERLANEPHRFGADVRERLEAALKHSAVDYALARQAGREWRQALRELFRERVDVLVTPASPVPAPEIAGIENAAASRVLVRFTYPFSLSALPALSVPCGFTDDGLPVGLQLVAPEEMTVLQLAHVYQQATGWHARRPEL